MKPLSHTGILLLDKPAGWTSHDVVSHVRRHLRERRVGHAGTLDPMATGLLIVLLGAATRLSAYFTAETKVYIATIRFGISTDSLDASGQVTERLAPQDARLVTLLSLFSHPHDEIIFHALEHERSRTLQVPPAISAIHVDGKRSYERTRLGEIVTLEPRKVHVDTLDFHHTGTDEDGYPHLTVQLRVSKGYYVRSFARDLGNSLGVPAHLTSLRRVASGTFTIDDAVAIPTTGPSDLLSYILTLPQALPRIMSCAELTAEGAVRAGCGKTLTVEHFVNAPLGGIAAWLAQEVPVAIGRFENGVGMVVRGFPTTTSAPPDQPTL